MIGYITLGTNDLARATTFYDALMTEFGAKRLWEGERGVAWGVDWNKPSVGVMKPFDGQTATVGNGVMVALAVKSREQVDHIHQKALELGATDEGAAGSRGTGFYAGYFRDPDGNKLNVFLHGLMTTAVRGLLAALRADLAAQADPARAPAMQAYMKSALPYLGVPTPLLRKVLAAAVARQPLADAAALAAAMQTLWRSARHREERYAAIELARPRPHRALPTLDLLPVFEDMIRAGAWWDYCDNLSGNEIAVLLAQHPREMKPRLRRWAKCRDLWLRRAAILCQRGLRAEFDVALFYDCIAPSIGSGRFADEFFMRKGIGWALRERSYTAPDEVLAYCCDRADELSPLTRREALKVIARRAAI